MEWLYRKKGIDALQDEAHTDQRLKRALGPINLTAVGVGAIVGAGIFVLSGQAAARYAGPGIVLSFVLAAVACGFAGLCYAEFAALIPISGSAYSYAYATLGEFFAWFIGWDLVLEYAMSAATVAVGWSGYLASLLRSFGLHLPAQLLASPGTDFVFVPAAVLAKAGLLMPEGWHEVGNVAEALQSVGFDPATLAHATAWCNVPAAIIVGLVTALLVVGIRESAMVNTVIVVLKLVVIVTVIVVGWSYIRTENWVPFVPQNTGSFGSFGWSGIARGAGVIFFAYIGFDAVSTVAQEAKNPQRDMPIGILGSLFVCTVLYILVGLVLTGVVNYTQLGVPDPIALAIDAMGIGWLAPVVKLGALAGLTSVIVIALMGQPRIFYSMSKDGLLPAVFSKVHPRFRTPHVTTVITGVAVAAVAGVLPMNLLGELVSIGTLAAFVVVCAGVLVLRHRHPELPRPFRVPFVPLIPALGILFCFSLMLGLPFGTWMRLLGWMALGFAIYFSYGVRHSRLNAASARSIEAQARVLD